MKGPANFITPLVSQVLKADMHTDIKTMYIPEIYAI